MTIEIYTKTFCPYCWRAKRCSRPRASNIRRFPSITAERRRELMIKRANGRTTVPQIFIREHHVGGCDDLVALDRSGKLDDLFGE